MSLKGQYTKIYFRCIIVLFLDITKNILLQRPQSLYPSSQKKIVVPQISRKIFGARGGGHDRLNDLRRQKKYVYCVFFGFKSQVLWHCHFKRAHFDENGAWNPSIFRHLAGIQPICSEGIRILYRDQILKRWERASYIEMEPAIE